MPQVEPYALKDAPSLIEKVFPAQKISIEAQKERKAGSSQTLPKIGSYWKGRKPLILVRAILMGILLPLTNNPKKDLDIYEKIMGIHDTQLPKRYTKLRMHAHSIAKWISRDNPNYYFDIECDDDISPSSFPVDFSQYKNLKIKWKDDIDGQIIDDFEYIAKYNYLMTFSYADNVKSTACERPEKLDQHFFYQDIWADVNKHYEEYGIKAYSHEELTYQLGILRFGRKPKSGDTFCGAGSIPYESARVGCDTYASDLNPVGCMLTWGSINIIGAHNKSRDSFLAHHNYVIKKIKEEIDSLKIEDDNDGNKAKYFLHCNEIKCPQTGWKVPLAPSWIISQDYSIIADLVPDYKNKRFDIEILEGVSQKKMEKAAKGSVVDDDIVYHLGGDEIRYSVASLRGDHRQYDNEKEKYVSKNSLRMWAKEDFKPRPDDIFQERIYCVQWIDKNTINKKRRKIIPKGVSDTDLENENKVEEYLGKNLQDWQDKGFIPDIDIEPGQKTNEPIRTRGWTHWHHLFSPRQLLIFGLFRKYGMNPIPFFQALNWNSKLSRWNSGHRNGKGFLQDTFYNQALNTLYNWGCRSFHEIQNIINAEKKYKPNIVPNINQTIKPSQAKNINEICDIFITDPPYADAVNYHEITEFFTAWVKKNPPEQFKDWVWDTRRPMAIKGKDEEFRKSMVEAYKAMAEHMPDNGVQCVMFTHQDASLWSDMASIFWGAGLQVMSAWYIATETNAAYQKGASHVQGTVILMLKKRPEGEQYAFSSELVEDIADEVKEQIETMTGLNQQAKDSGRSENIFEDADLQMAGYAAALRVLTGYTHVDGDDMRSLAMRPRKRNEKTVVDEVVDYAAQVANNMLVPEGISEKTWEVMKEPERFYLKMLDIESTGARKLDNYQNFAKAFRVGEYQNLMANTSPNKARLKSSKEFKVRELGTGILSETILGGFIFALKELQNEKEASEVLNTLRQNVPNYYNRREIIKNLATYIEEKTGNRREDEAKACRVIYGLIYNESW